MTVYTGTATNANMNNTNQTWCDFIKLYTPNTIELPLDEEGKKYYKRNFMLCAFGGKLKDDKRKNDNVIERDVLALDLDNIIIKDYAELHNKISTMVGYHAFVYPTISCQNGFYRYRVVIPIENGGITNEEEYKMAIRLFLNRAKQDGIIDKIDNSNLTWSQIFGLPLKTQYTPKQDLKHLVHELQAEPLTIDELHKLVNNFKNQQDIYQEQASFDFAHGYLNDNGVVKTVKEFVQRHAEWLKEYNNYLACQFEIKYAEQHKEITHDEALNLVALLANGNQQWEHDNQVKYEQDKTQVKRGKGMAYFVSKQQAHYVIPWLYYNQNKQRCVDYDKLTKEIREETPIMSNDFLPTEKAIYFNGHWNFFRVDDKINSIISRKMNLAHIWDRNKHLDEAVFLKNATYFDGMKQREDLINQHPYYVQADNCTIDVRTMQTHDNDYHDYIPNYHHFNYRHEYLDSNGRLKKSEYPKLTLSWLRFLTKNDDNVNFLLTLIGYCFINTYEPSQIVTFLNGGGGNGKSTFLTYLINLIGKPNVSTVDLEPLANPEMRFMTSKLLYKNANIFADINNKKIKSFSKIKTLTGGDMITGEFKGGDIFDFTNYAKLIFSANEIPLLNDLSDAVIRRIRIINFPQKIDSHNIKAVQEKYPLDKIYQERDKMIMLCLQKIHDFINGERSLLAPNAYMQRSINKWLKKMDIGKVFNEYLVSSEKDFNDIQTWLHINQALGETPKKLYLGYCYLCKCVKQKPVTKSEFMNDILKFDEEKSFRGMSGTSKIRLRYPLLFAPSFFETVEEYNKNQADENKRLDLNDFTFYEEYQNKDYTDRIFDE